MNGYSLFFDLMLLLAVYAQFSVDNRSYDEYLFVVIFVIAARASRCSDSVLY